MGNDIEYFESILNKYRNKGKFEVFKMGFSTDMDLTKKSDGELLLGHSILHTCYSKYSDKIPRSAVKELHNKFTKEFNNRKINHNYFDSLDRC